jgi:S1-C subfamily serine protease
MPGCDLPKRKFRGEACMTPVAPMSGVSRRTALGLLGGAAMTNLPAFAEEIARPDAEVSIALEQVQQCTTIIRCVNRQGVPSSGTGFFFAFFRHDNQEVPAIVTNKHVIAGAEKGILHWTRKKADGRPDIGNTHDVLIEAGFENYWLAHPDPSVDLAVLPIAGIISELAKGNTTVYLASADQTSIPKEQDFKDLLPMEDVLVVGYPDGISDIKNNIPVFRRGITATPAYVDFEGRGEFLIDAAIYPGSSGSPVFIYNQGTWLNRTNAVSLGTRLLLVGVVYGVAQHSVNGELRIVPAPTQRQITTSLIPNNLGICIRSSRILEFEPLIIKRGYVKPEGYVIRAK